MGRLVMGAYDVGGRREMETVDGRSEMDWITLSTTMNTYNSNVVFTATQFLQDHSGENTLGRLLEECSEVPYGHVMKRAHVATAHVRGDELKELDGLILGHVGGALRHHLLGHDCDQRLLPIGGLRVCRKGVIQRGRHLRGRGMWWGR